MATRKIIDAEHNGEKVWIKGHARAIYMSDGSTVEDTINNIQTGGITTETDPIFSASPAAGITDENISSWNKKVDKVDGKQLSTEDFTTLLKQKLEGLSNYDDTSIQESVSKLRADLDTLVSGNTATAIESFNEIIAFLDGIEDSESLDSIIASIEQQIAAKYTKPSTGISKNDLASDVQTSLEKADTALQEHQDISGKQDVLVSGTNIKSINGESILGEGNLILSTGSGTITEVKANGTSIATSGVVDIPAASTSVYGVTELTDSTSSTSTTTAATPNSVRLAYNLANGKAAKVTVSNQTATSKSISPNIFYVWGTMSTLSITLATPSDSTIYNEYMFQFTSGTTATTLSLPSSVTWATEPLIESGKTYQVSIVNNLAVIGGF